MFKQKTYKRKLYRKLGTNLGYEMANKSINEGKGLSPFSRLVYFALTQGHMLINSKISNASYSDIQAFTGISSRSTISRCLEELKTNGFIVKSTEKGKEGKYILLKAVFFGHEEREYETKKEVPMIKREKVFKKSTSPSIGPILRRPINNNSSSLVSFSGYIKKQKHKDFVSVFFKNGDTLNLKASSPFNKLTDQSLVDLHFKFGKDILQEKIELLEIIYHGNTAKIFINQTPDSLLACACYRNYLPNEKQERRLKAYRKQKFYDLNGETIFKEVDLKARKESVVDKEEREITISDPTYVSKFSFEDLFGAIEKEKSPSDFSTLNDWILHKISDDSSFDQKSLLTYGKELAGESIYLMSNNDLIIKAFQKVYPHYVNSFYAEK